MKQLCLQLGLGAFVIAIGLGGVGHATQRKEERAVVASPDNQLRAILITLDPRTDHGGDESRVEIRDRSGKLLSVKDFSSSDSNHGGVVAKDDWTPDSQFFVFNVESSGGHQPWRSPVWFYSRRDQKFREISELLGGRPVLEVSALPFEIIAPHSVRVTTWTRPGVDSKNEVTLVVDLIGPAPTQPTH